MKSKKQAPCEAVSYTKEASKEFGDAINSVISALEKLPYKFWIPVLKTAIELVLKTTSEDERR